MNERYKDQYSAGTYQQFDQLENRRKFIIIDDFDKLEVRNLRYRSVLLDRINTRYPNVVITGNDLFQIGEIIAEENHQLNPLKDYQQYVILQFGNTLRTELINRWNALGRDEYLTDAEILRKNDETKQVVDTIIGKNLVPSYPVFLLTILQGIEMGRPLNLEESSYGHYYQFLIGGAIRKVARSNDEIDAYFNFLTEFAHFLLATRTREISVERLSEFHREYCHEFAVSYSLKVIANLDSLVSNLVAARMIEETDQRYRFKYKYVYYFFAARYLANTITEADTRRTVSEMCKRLYVEDFADTIMFLTHHSKDPFIIKEILANARQSFPESHPVRFDQDVGVINRLLQAIPRLVLEDRDVREERKKADRLKDQIEMAEKQDASQEDVGPDITQETAQLDVVGQLNMTFKMLQILGQVLRNYHSSLKGPLKLSIAEEAYLLGLRSLEPFFKVLETHTDYMVTRIESFVERKKLVDESRIKDSARRFLFGLCTLVSCAFVKQVSDSVGSEHLSETFAQILEKHDTNSVRLVDISIKLDFYRTFPFDELKALQKRLEHNWLPLTMLKEMVIGYLYMFPTDERTKQRICAVLDIPVQTQRMIDAGSTQKRV